MLPLVLNWDAVTGDVAYNLAITMHKLYGAHVRGSNALVNFILETMPWTYPMITTLKTRPSSELRRDVAYEALTGTTLLVPWRLATTMQGVGKTTAALFFACRPLTKRFWEKYNTWIGLHPPPFDDLEDCVDALVSEGLVVNNMDSLRSLVNSAVMGKVKYPVVVLDDLGAWATSRDTSVWAELTKFITTFRRFVGVAIGTAAALNHVFVDIRRNATLVGEVGTYVSGKCGGIRVTWVRCIDKSALCQGPNGRFLVEVYDSGPASSMICDDVADRIRITEGYRTLNTVLRGALVMAPVVEDVVEEARLRCSNVNERCAYVGSGYVDRKCVEGVLARHGFNVELGTTECVDLATVRAVTNKVINNRDSNNE